MDKRDQTRHWHLYVLKLEEDKWYIGISTDVEKRFKQHMSGFASAAWTKKYKPIKIQDTRYLGDIAIDKAQQIEGRITRKYMEKYGDENVRGGDLTDVDGYRRRFGRFVTKSDWQVVTIAAVLGLIIIYLLLDKFIISPTVHTVIIK
ncbi:MAG: hypothetical protein JWN75_775 [Candidatus Saccharibacteria bacterium]|nr:hypothetical protein [Candidatus Saccharibacteria bacterium]